MTVNKFNGINRFLKGKGSFCALLLAMIFLFTTSIVAYAVEAPTAEPPAATYGGMQNVELKTKSVAASVYYTTDGTDPTTTTGTLYIDPIEVETNMTIKAYATDGTDNSSVSTFEYILFAGGSGTEADPYQVATAEQLNNVRYHLDGHFKQTENIDLGVAPYNTDPGWEPIGDGDFPFTGTFDGNGKTICSLTINQSNTYVGLFGATGDTAEIENVKLEDTDVTGQGIGTLVGWNQGKITNSNAIGAVTGVDYVGGLMGEHGDGSITDSYATGAVDHRYKMPGL
jgi:hypothetical protein